MPKRARRGASIQKTLQAVDTPVFLVDNRRTLTFFNAGCEALTGWSAAELLGETCDYAGDANLANATSVTSALCPPPEVFAGETASAPAYISHRDGSTVPRLIHFFPLTGPSGKGSAVVAALGVMAPLPAPRAAPETTPARRLHAELAAHRAALRARYGLKSIVVRSQPMLRAVQQVHLARATKTPALLCGERGAGKEHLARVVHTESETRTRSFVPLDCAANPEFELRSTLRRLFSHDPEDRRVEPSVPTSLLPGTLFLQNVEALPRDLQEFVAKELAVETSKFQVRVLAGTTADLKAATHAESFRTDLYFQLTALTIDLPPLRDRVDEIPLLAQAFLEEHNRGADAQHGGFSDEVLRQFREYRWPGNLDELAAVVAEARDAATAPIIHAVDLPFRFRTGRDAQEVGPAPTPRPQRLEEYLLAVEKEQIERALEQTKNNRSLAAKLLGMPRPRLYRRMETLGIATEGPPDASDEGDEAASD